MTSFSGRGIRAGLLLATACLALAGCKTTGKGMPEEEQQADSAWINPFEDKPFKENEFTLPALPRDEDLIPFTVNGSDSFRFAVDPKSISVGADRVVRYTVVITSAGGGRNVTYEGMRCDAFERRIYATLPKGATAWVPNLGEDRDLWRRMETRSRNAYAATLATDYFCEGRTVAGKPEKLIRDLKAYAPSH
ncbi:MAG: hypothetical protein CL858_05960 [Cupriavidus sp.]|nr:hypothetical protein [Cupriavidus sp.]